MAANVYVGEAALLVQTTGVDAVANVYVGEARIEVSGTTPTSPTVANVYVGEARMEFEDSPITPTPANVYVGEAYLEFGSAPIVTPTRTGLWCYRGGVLAPAYSLMYDQSGALV